MAEVSLVFHNDGQLEVPWSEVAVARRLYRTGESEYLLNRNVCRLRDIQDLFAGTGVNPKAYALMDQERLNHVLTAKPWERRVFIEEAAGIARYKQQRAETQGKLEATRQNLTRVRDVMEEVRRQLGSIERQARKARQYKALHQEKQVLDLALLAADWAALAAQHEALTREMAELHEMEERERTRIAGLSARHALETAAIQETEHRLADLRQSVQKIQSEAERLLERREQMGAQIRDLGEEDVRLAGEIGSLGERRLSLAHERDGKLHDLGEARARHADRAEPRDRDRGGSCGLPRDPPRSPRAPRRRCAAEQIARGRARARAEPGGRRAARAGSAARATPRATRRRADPDARGARDRRRGARPARRDAAANRSPALAAHRRAGRCGGRAGQPWSTCGPRRRSRSPSFA